MWKMQLADELGNHYDYDFIKIILYLKKFR